MAKQKLPPMPPGGGAPPFGGKGAALPFPPAKKGKGKKAKKGKKR